MLSIITQFAWLEMKVFMQKTPYKSIIDVMFSAMPLSRAIRIKACLTCSTLLGVHTLLGECTGSLFLLVHLMYEVRLTGVRLRYG